MLTGQHKQGTFTQTHGLQNGFQALEAEAGSVWVRESGVRHEKKRKQTQEGVGKESAPATGEEKMSESRLREK